MRQVHSLVAGQWVAPGSGARAISSAITGDVIAEAGNDTLDVHLMRTHAREVGGPALRAMSFHDRARMLKAVAMYLRDHRQTLYDLSFDTGATQADHLIDVDGGIGTMLVFASKGRREMPDGHVYLDGATEQLGRSGQFQGRHVCTPLQGVAVHINAFNFPVWGMLEKIAPCLLAGMPTIVKPATATSYVTEACVRLIQASGLLPKGALQLIAGGTGELLDHLDCQDVVTFTGSANTALTLRKNENLLSNGVRFTPEQDSLNASVLGPDAVPGTPEFDLFVKEVIQEMTTKAGQKCTAIRRVMVPATQTEAVIDAVRARLSDVSVGDPRAEGTQMGALVSNAQKNDVLDKVTQIGAEAERLCGDPDAFAMSGSKGAFLPPILFHCADPDAAQAIHDVEAFGPVSTILPYRDLEHAAALLNRGKGSLVASIVTHDADAARQITLASACFHGRLYFNNRDSMTEATGHGAPLPHMVHGGPGRAGGGEELGGIRAVLHYMQRTAIQGSPDILSGITGQWVPGAVEATEAAHPFTRPFGDLRIGDTLHSAARQITLEDIETFAHFTGDTFYAHMDDDAARANPFFPGRVAHGYLLLSFAAGLFVQPDPGPVLANTGLDNLRFMKPVEAGDSIKVRLTVKAKTPRNDDYGEVRWHVTLLNQNEEVAAEYELLTMNAH
ncbi:phenylacetic acid degradation bifunctional protein PaaZ [uncultured Tateyamaria sp.]|uniref:phenylacetic acid degradation bifunctional protein PaaZ n=1 Tax=uncultured Tateyamaria sp. TaxID=455651 RepID=UPI00260C9967|nr:phenylacetic acid degradation bifunctional protein PaaZ [uncultured Tateyamaria sp.]